MVKGGECVKKEYEAPKVVTYDDKKFDPKCQNGGILPIGAPPSPPSAPVG